MRTARFTWTTDMTNQQEELAHSTGEIAEPQIPVSAGDGDMASGAAALASSAVRESVPNRPKMEAK